VQPIRVYIQFYNSHIPLGRIKIVFKVEVNKLSRRDNVIEYLKGLSESDCDLEIREVISKSFDIIIHSEEFSSQAATTNAVGFGLDVFDIINTDFNDDACVVSFEYNASGTQEDDKPLLGTSISGTAEAVIDADGDVTYQNITAVIDNS
jgi:hypothetical protein